MNEDPIYSYLASNPKFRRQEDGQGKRWFVMEGGSKVGYVYFKWALDGWNVIMDGQNRVNVKSVDDLIEATKTVRVQSDSMEGNI